jgi:hypothetical protein
LETIFFLYGLFGSTEGEGKGEEMRGGIFKERMRSKT